MSENSRCQCSFTTGSVRESAALVNRPSARGRTFRAGAGGSVSDAFRKNGRGAAPIALLLFCLLSFSLLFALAASRSGAAVTASAYRTAMNGGDGLSAEEDDEDLGKLKLVELPGMLTVFAPSDSPILPLSMAEALVEDDLTVKVYAPAGTEIVSVLDGKVRSVTEGGAEGGIVTVSHSGDIEITFYGLRDIRVERGQPVLQRSVLGYTAGDVLRIRVTKCGRPIDPVGFFGAAAGLS